VCARARVHVPILKTHLNILGIRESCFGVALVSRLLKIVGLFCKRAL